MALRNEEEPPMAEVVSCVNAFGVVYAPVQAEAVLRDEDDFIDEMIHTLGWPRDRIRANLVGYEVVVLCKPSDLVKMCTSVEELCIRHELHIANQFDLELGDRQYPCKRALYINPNTCSGNPKTLREAWLFFRSRPKDQVVRARLKDSVLKLVTTMDTSEVKNLLKKDFIVEFKAFCGMYVKLSAGTRSLDVSHLDITLRASHPNGNLPPRSSCCIF
jgi:hypothetical protein